MTGDPESASPEPEILFVGNVRDTEWDYKEEPATVTPAGVDWQRHFLGYTRHTNLVVGEVLSQRPLQLFPAGRSLFEMPSTFSVDGQAVRNIPFINMRVLRQVSAGAYVFLGVLAWSFRNRTRSRIVVQFNLSEPPALFTVLACRVSSTQFVPIVLDVNVPGSTVSRSWSRRLDYWLQRKVLPRCDALIVATHAIASDFAEGVPFLVVDGAVRSKAGVRRASQDDNLFHVVYAGGLERFEGVADVVEAFESLPAEEYRFTIAGDGELREFVEAAQSRISNVDYVGRLCHHELYELYSNADLLIMPRESDYPGSGYFFPSKLFEYMATGVPVLVGHSGPAVKYSEFVYSLGTGRSPQSIRERVVELRELKSQERAAKATAAKNFVLANKTWEIQSRRMASFLTSVLGRSPRGESDGGEI